MRRIGNRFTVAQKIIAGLAVIIVIGMLSMLLIYRGLTIVENNVHRLAEVEEPLNAAAYEMELNVNGIGFATLKYLATLEPDYRRAARKDEGDFAAFHMTYLELARTPREVELGREVGQIFPRFKELGRSLMAQRDAQEVLFVAVARDLEKIDEILDRQVEPLLRSEVASERAAPQKAIILANLEAESAEVGFWVINYQRRHSVAARQKIFDKIGEFKRLLAEIRALPLKPVERLLLADIDMLSARMIGSIRRVVTIEDSVVVQRQQFIDLRSAMDDRFDGEIQGLALEGLDIPRQEAEVATEEVIGLMRFLIPLYVAAAAVVGLLLVALITRPLRQLKQGTEAISRGDLSHRVASTDNDEFGDLADQFNLMVEQLQATTVSKELLKDSQEKLQQTVASLRQEIREREALQVELRQAETMAAMGSLVAGVAHEVRNPLFGISSTLDAMNARFGERPEYRRYLDVLRLEITRLSKLMGDLLDYGKPVSPDYALGPMRPVIDQAIEACKPLADEIGARIVVEPGGMNSPVRMSGRMVQVFQNLIENALQHSSAGGVVTVAVRPAGDDRDALDCIVMDTGKGFAADDLPRLFEPFFTSRRHGTGLGLAIVQRLVAEHGGHVFAYNRREGGAAVVVRLAIAQRAAA